MVRASHGIYNTHRKIPTKQRIFCVSNGVLCGLREAIHGSEKGLISESRSSRALLNARTDGGFRRELRGRAAQDVAVGIVNSATELWVTFVRIGEGGGVLLEEEKAQSG